MALTAIDGAHGGSACRGGRAFYFAGYKHIFLSADQVKLAACTVAKVSIEYFEPLSTQVRGCYQLAVFAQIGAVWR